jgi:glucokinase
MLLAGDIGGTKTLLGLFERQGERPRPLVVRE